MLNMRKNIYFGGVGFYYHKESTLQAIDRDIVNFIVLNNYYLT